LHFKTIKKEKHQEGKPTEKQKDKIVSIQHISFTKLQIEEGRTCLNLKDDGF